MMDVLLHCRSGVHREDSARHMEWLVTLIILTTWAQVVNYLGSANYLFHFHPISYQHPIVKIASQRYWIGQKACNSYSSLEFFEIIFILDFLHASY